MLIPASFFDNIQVSYSYNIKGFSCLHIRVNYVLNGIRFGIDRKNYMRLKSFG